MKSKNTAALARGHTQFCQRIVRWFLEKHLEGMQENDFQTLRTFHPRPTQEWPQINHSSLCKPSPNEWCSHSKTQNDIFGPNTTTIWVLRCQVQNKSTRAQIDSYVRRFASGRSVDRPGEIKFFPYFKSTHCVCKKNWEYFILTCILVLPNNDFRFFSA